jgi:hypothetical protein
VSPASESQRHQCLPDGEFVDRCRVSPHLMLNQVIIERDWWFVSIGHDLEVARRQSGSLPWRVSQIDDPDALPEIDDSVIALPGLLTLHGEPPR